MCVCWTQDFILHESDIWNFPVPLSPECHHFCVLIDGSLHFYVWKMIVGMDNVCMFASVSAEQTFEVSLQW